LHLLKTLSPPGVVFGECRGDYRQKETNPKMDKRHVKEDSGPQASPQQRTSLEIWKQMALPPEHEEVAEAYFDAIIVSCREKGLVLTEEHGLFVCVPPTYLSTIPILNVKRSEPLRVVEHMHEFLQLLKDRVDEHAKKQGLPSAGQDDYWSVLMGQMQSMIKESGAVHRIMEIDKRSGLNRS
jgi:hypothetical protein